MTRKDILVQALRSVFGVFIGLMLILIIAEGIEFLLVALVHGSITTDQDVYFGIRNRPPMLTIKFVYNTFAGFVGGYVAAWIAGRASVWHGLALATVQLAGLIYGMTVAPYASTTPMWAWITLAATMTPAIVVGSWVRRRRALQRSRARSDPDHTADENGRG